MVATILWDRVDNIYAVQRLSGDIDPPGRQITDITRPFEDGTAYVEMGRRGVPTNLSFRCIAANPFDARNLHHIVKRLQSKIVAIRLNEVIYTNYLVISSGVGNRVPTLTTVGGVLYTGVPIGNIGSSWVVDVGFLVQYAGTTFL